MKSKILIAILTICLVITYMPVTTFAANGFVVEGEQSTDEELNNESMYDDEEGDTNENLDISDNEDLDESDDVEYSEDIEKSKSQIESILNSEIEFSSKRLIVKGLKQELKDEPVIASLNGVYLLQYEDSEDAIEAYYRLSEISDSVEFDKSMYVASDLDIIEVDENGDIYEVDPMTEEENPFAETKDISVTPDKYDVAVIDTGSNTADKIVSVIGDDGKDTNGHGQTMVNAIKEYAPNAKVLSIKAIGDNGIGDASAVYAAIRLAIDEKVDVINLSISAMVTEDNFIIEEIIKEAESKGITVVGAAGNNSVDAGLTIPGKVEEATIVSIVDEEGNTGNTVDYYLPATSTSMATAIVSGLILSNTLKDYTVTNKVIDIELDEGYIVSHDLNGDFEIQGEGSAGDSGTIHGGSGPSKYFNGCVCVWYDHGKNSEGKYYQGSLRKDGSEYKWTRPTGDSYQNTDKYPSAEKACMYFWLNRMSKKIQEMGKGKNWGDYSDSHWKGYTTGWSAGTDGYNAFKSSAKKACQRAISRSNGKAKRARIIGAACTFYSTDTGHKSAWSIGNVASGKRDYYDLFKRHGYVADDDDELDWKLKFPDWTDKQHVYSRTAGYLEDKGYIPSNIPSSWEDDEYRDYIWKKIGKDANPNSDIKNPNGRGWRVILIALNDQEPIDDPLYLDIQKTWSNPAAVNNNSLYSLEGVKFYVYKTQADARSGSNVYKTFTMKADGTSTSGPQEIVGNKTYYLVEDVSNAKGAIVIDSLKAANGGYAFQVGSTGKTININDGPAPPSYGVSYSYDQNYPSAVMATLPTDSNLYPDGSTVFAQTPTSDEVVVGSDVYVFDGWDEGDKDISGGPVAFVGSWHIEEEIPYADTSEYEITTEVVNGTITESFTVPASTGDDGDDDALDKTIEYSPNEGCVLNKILVDGVEVDITQYPSSYTFNNINSSHTIRVEYIVDE